MKAPVNLLALYIFLLLSVGCGDAGAPKEADSNSIEITLKSLDLKDLKGQTLDTSKFKGKRVFVNFWATWCKPCLAEMPSISSAADSLQRNGVIFLAASDENPERIEAFRQKNDYSFQIISTGSDISLFEIFALPATFIFDESGKLVYRETGARKWDSPESIQLIMEN